MWMSFWISRWQPITVILSVSVSSTVLTQLPEDGEPAWFNHLLTHSMMITHTARRQVDGCSIVTALSPLHIMIPQPAPHLASPQQKLPDVDTSLYSFLWTSCPDRPQIPKINLTLLIRKAKTIKCRQRSNRYLTNAVASPLCQYKSGLERWMSA